MHVSRYYTLVLLGLNAAFLVWIWNNLMSTDVSNLTDRSSVRISGEQITNTTWNFNWDGHPQVSTSQHDLPKRWKYIYLIRHGHYFKVNDLKSSDPRIGHLSALGEQQAQLVGQRLRDLNITFHRFVTSTSTRASETAHIIKPYLPHARLEEDDLLREGWPMFPNPAQQGWDPEDPAFHKDKKRLDEAFTKYFFRAQPSQHIDSNELIVAHGNIISFFVLKALQLPQERWLKIAVQQASITMLVVFHDGNVDLRILGDVGHLAISQWTVQ
ncbi:hypothetical protein CAPTEDRAFT_160628 [Capitella teleta]|uniref:Serine/threonine-protein phosphatase PGAM5, mitochondrial n=1 Tax=Capitella teleta TaxID=283909 RepID=R7V2L0_CAPTE|nr:hypothetical protein CAPTEDRAFT_160628 [Capitella teleta]|eukprot:ELU12692.1 hypothetical protein CAPTEDRAFT_160628 [Capitella teleta]